MTLALETAINGSLVVAFGYTQTAIRVLGSYPNSAADKCLLLCLGWEQPANAPL